MIEWTGEAAVECAKIRDKLEKRGEMIGPCDVPVAAQAKFHGHSVVTHSEREFRRVVGRKLDDWCQGR